MSTRRLFLPTIPITFFVLLFGVSAYLGAAVTYDPALVGDSLLAVGVSVGLYLAVAYAIRNRSMARFVAVIVMALCLGFALLFIGQFRYQEYPELSELIRTLGEATTFLPDLSLGYLHPNVVATVLEVVFPMAVAFALARRSMAVRIAGGVMAMVFLYAILVTYSRGAYVGLAGALIAVGAGYLVARLPRFIIWGAAILLLVGAVAGVAALYHLDPAQPLPILNRPVDSRLTLYHNSLYLGRDYLFTGLGLGDTFGSIYSRYSLLIQSLFLSYSSNLFLAVWLNQGLLGLAAFLGLIVTFYRYVARIIRRTEPSIMFHGVCLGVTATLVHGLFDARQYIESPWVMPVLFIALGLAIAYGQIALAEEGLWLSIRRWIRLPLMAAGATLVMLGLIFIVFRTPLTAAWHTNQGALEETRADLAPTLNDPLRNQARVAAQRLYEQALDIDPDYPPANRRLGNLYVGRETFTAAIPLLERAYAGEPTNPAAVKGLGLAYVWVGRTQEAAALLQRLPDVESMANELYTWGYFRSGEEQRKPLLAAYAWETAEYMGSAGNVEVWMQIAAFYEQAGALDRARAAYQHIITVDPNYSVARDALAALDG